MWARERWEEVGERKQRRGKQEEVSETTSSREWNWRRESELERIKSKERAGDLWPEAASCLIRDGWSRCDGQSEGGISTFINSV